MDYGIAIKLDTNYKKESILKILERGKLKGFIYYDQINYEKYIDTPIINSIETANKIMAAYEKNIDGGPAVFSLLEGDTNATLWFYNREGVLEFFAGSLGCPKKKGFYIDFAYYTKMFLDLVEDFPVLEIKTEMF